MAEFPTPVAARELHVISSPRPGEGHVIPEEIQAVSPVTGEVIARYAPASEEEVRRAVERGRAAFAGWSVTPIPERVRLLGRLRGLLVQGIDEHVARIAAATGKPHVEALAGDLLTCVDFIRYHEAHAAEHLAPEPRPGGLLFGLSKFHVEYSPIGVVAVFSPWNYPLQLALIPTVTALAAGNTVVLKPSEITPTVGELIGGLCREAGFPADVVQIVQGGPAVGRALIAARPDKIFFTGSVATGREVMRAAAEQLIPLELELGGKDPMIVFADANLERAVRGAVYGAFANAGQACVSVERLYVERPIYERFVQRAAEEAAKLRVGSGLEADIGPIISAAQLDKIEAHLADAVERGARVVGQKRVDGRRFHPLVLRDADHTMRVMREETFGPLLPVMPFDGEEQAVTLANDSDYGLSGSVWTRDLERGRRVAGRLVCGSCAVNDVIKNISNPHVPFGGERQSGFGRYHGPEGLRAFSRVRSVMVSGGMLPREINWFPYGRAAYNALKLLIQAGYGEGGAGARVKGILESMLGMIK